MNEKILAFHYDMKRPMWSTAYFEKLTGRLKDWGYNTIIYEIEDKLKFSRHPVISHPEALSHEETARFVASVRKKGLDVIPLSCLFADSSIRMFYKPFIWCMEAVTISSRDTELREK